MANDIEQLVVSIAADTKDLRAELKTAVATLKDSTKQMNDAVQEMAKKGGKSTSMFQTAFATMTGFLGSQVVLGAFDMVRDSAVGLFKAIIVDGVKSASEAQEAMTSMNQALLNTGIYSEETSREMDRFTDSLEKNSNFSAEAALGAASLIQNIAKLDKDGLQQATQSAADLAAAMKIDLNTAAQTIGKAIEGNTGALRRYGIEVEASSDKSKNFGNVMQALAGLQGSAQAQSKTLAGTYNQLKVAWGDLTEVFGKSVVENVAVLNAMGSLRNFVREATNAIEDSGPAFKVFIADALKPAAAAFNMVAQGALFFASQLNNMRVASAVSELDSLIEKQGILTDQLEAAKRTGGNMGMFQIDPEQTKAIEAELTAVGEAIKKQQKIVQDTGESAEKVDDALGKISQAASSLDDSVSGFDSVRAGVESVQVPLSNMKQGVDNVKLALTEAQETSKAFAESLIKDATEIQASYAMDLETYKMLLEEKMISEEDYWATRLVLLEERQAEEQALLTEGLAVKQATEEQAALARSALEQKQTTELKKIQAERLKNEQALNEQRLQQTSQMFGNLSSLTRTGSKELAAIGKAAAIAQATIDTYAGANKALAQGGPFLGPALAASIVVAGLVNVSKIASTPLASGIDEVPGIGSRDNFPAILAPGERVVPSETNKDLKEFLARGGSGGPSISVSIVMNDVFSSDPREMGLKIVETINEVAEANGVRILRSAVQ